MKRLLIFFVVLACICLLATASSAAITVITVKGQVAYKNEGAWQPLAANMVLAEGTKISTGINSSAVIAFIEHNEKKREVTIQQLTLIKIYQNAIVQNDRNIKIGLRRGTIRAKVEHDKETDKRIKTVFKVSTPVATSSVRGTEEIITYGPSVGMVVQVVEGRITGENKNGSKKYISGKLLFHQRTSNPLPEPLLVALKDQAMVDIYDRSITHEERQGFDRTGSDAIDTPSDGPVQIFRNTISPAHVTITIDW
jgi:hypothetical protein